MTTQFTGASTDPGSKTAAEVEREVRQSRARVERTLDQIQERLSPGQLVDQAVAYLGESGGGEFARNLGRSVRDNPLPVALVAVGLGWMMVSSQRTEGSYRHGRDHGGSFRWDGDEWVGGEAEASPLYPTALAPLETGAGESSMAAHIGTSAAGEKADELVERARGATEAVVAGARKGADAVGDHVRRATTGAQQSLHEAELRARSYGRRARHGIVESFYDQPLVLGAIGVAVGAAIGAALPPTDTEDTLLGSTSDRIARDAEKTAREQLSKARATAEAAVAAGRAEADRQGLDADAAKTAAGSLRGKVERVAEAAKDAAEEKAHEEGLGRRGDATS